MPGKVIHCTSSQEYHQALQEAGDRLVVVDCYADWCAPCVAMAPVFEAMSLQYTEIVFIKVDIDRAPEIKSLLGVWCVTTYRNKRL
jgi:thioredoxin 1